MSNEPSKEQQKPPQPPEAEAPFPAPAEEDEPTIMPIEAPGVQVTVADAMERGPAPAQSAAAEPAPIVVMRPRSLLWPSCAAVFVVAILALALLVLFSAWTMGRGVQSVGDAGSTVYNDVKAGVKKAGEIAQQAAAKPNEIKNEFLSGIGALSHQSKFVVLTRTFTLTVDSRQKGWEYLPINDDSKVSFRVKNNAVQYVVPLDKMNIESLSYNEQEQLLTISLPPPRLDRDMLAVSSNPQDWETLQKKIGWTNITDWSGEKLTEQAKAQLEGQLVIEGQHPLLLQEAERAAKEQLQSLFQIFATHVDANVKVEVQFDGKLANTPGMEPWQRNTAPL